MFTNHDQLATANSHRPVIYPRDGIGFTLGYVVPEASSDVLAILAAGGLLAFAWYARSGKAAMALLRRRLQMHHRQDAAFTSPTTAFRVAVAWTALLGTVAVALAATSVQASPVIYQQLPDTSTAAVAVHDTVPRILADDFPLKQTTQVTDLHVFGAFLSDNLPAAGASDVTFSLSLHTDNGLSPSLPVNPPIWQSTTLPSATSAPLPITEAFYDPVAGFVGSDTMVFEYDFNISPITLGPGTYWLNVEAQPGVTFNGVNSVFGWATTAPASNLGDAAAWGSAALGNYPTPWNSSATNAANPPFNLAFEITGNSVPEPSTVGMAGLGLVALLALGCRRHWMHKVRAVQVSRRGRRAVRKGTLMRYFHRLIVATTVLLTLTAPSVQATNLVSNGEFNQFTQGGPNEFIADTPTAPDTQLTDWTNNRPFMALYAANSSELVGATGPSYFGGPIYLWGPLNGSNNGFTDTSPNQASDRTANFIAADADPTFPGTGISQTISTPLVAGQQYDLSYYWGANQDYGDTGATHSGWTVMLGTQQLVDGNSVFASIPSEGFSGWNFESITFTYSGGPSDLLSFLVIGGPASLPPIALLDSVTLEKVPEPLSVVLMGLGLLALIAIKLRHRARAALT